MPQPKSFFFDPRPQRVKHIRTFIPITLLFLLGCVLVLVFHSWQHEAHWNRQLLNREAAVQSYIERENTLLELDKLLQRGAILDEHALRSGEQNFVALTLRMRDAQRQLARPSLRLWPDPDAKALINDLHQLLELYVGLNSKVIGRSLPFSPEVDRQVLLSLLQGVHRRQIISASKLGIETDNLLNTERNFYVNSAVLLLILLAPIIILILVAWRYFSLAQEVEVLKNDAEQLFLDFPEPCLLLSQDARVVRASKSILPLLGYSPESLRGEQLYSLLPTRFLGRFQYFLMPVVNGVLSDDVAREFVLADHLGNDVPVELKLSAVMLGERQFFLLSIRDQAEQSRLYQQLNVSQKRFEMAVWATRDGMWDWDLNAKQTYFSQTWKEMLGFGAEAISNDEKDMFEKVIPEAEKSEFRAAIKAFFASRRNLFRFDHHLRHRDGHLLDVICRASVERNAEGRVIRVVGTHSDVTGIKRKEQEVFQLNRRLETLLQSQSDAGLNPLSANNSALLEVLGHEVRTPMNGLMGMSEMLLKSSLTADQQLMVKVIQDSSSNLLTVLDDLLDYSALQNGAVELQCQPFDVMVWLDDILQHYIPRLAGRAQQLHFIPAGGLPRVVYGDPLRLRQVVIKLLDNALKFSQGSKPHGIVKWSISFQEAKAGRLIFAVWDNGIGIDVHQHKKLFKAFAQGDSGYGRKFGGNGLGLAICAKLLQLMDGDIQFNSLPGQFTEAKVSVPVSLPKQPSSSEVRDEVVFVDIQNELIQQSVTAILKHAGYPCLRWRGSAHIIQKELAERELAENVTLISDGGVLCKPDEVDRLIVLLPRPKGEWRGGVDKTKVFTHPLLARALLDNLQQKAFIKA